MKFSKTMSEFLTTFLGIFWVMGLVTFIIEGWCPSHTRFVLVMLPMTFIWYKTSSWVIFKQG